MKLTEEAKAIIAKEFEELSKKNYHTLQELNIYKWALRSIFLLLFGGTILGVLKLQDYLDDRIQKRSEELSGIIYGSVAQNSGDSSGAIDQYYSFLEKLDNAVLRPSEHIRSIYYLRFIYALADSNQIDPTGEFEVKPAFSALINSKYFKKDQLSNSKHWRDDQGYLNSWGRCLVKFGDTQAEVESAREFFLNATRIANKSREIAANHFALAMLSLARGDGDAARKHLETAMEASPKTHGVQEYIGSYKDDLEDEYQTWWRAAKVFNQPGIDKRYEKIMKELIAEHRTKPASAAN